MLIIKNLITPVMLGTILAAWTLQANAEESSKKPSQTLLAQETTAQPESLADTFNRAFYHNTGRFFGLTNISGQANAIFGWRTFPGSFLDNMITNDAKVINALYTDVLRQQTSGPLIRTQDLPNPFDTSIQENPVYLSPSSP